MVFQALILNKIFVQYNFYSILFNLSTLRTTVHTPQYITVMTKSQIESRSQISNLYTLVFESVRYISNL